MTHTKGPWPIKRKGMIIKSIGPCIPDEYAGSAWLDINSDDANLIAAAPELLEALKRVASLMDFEDSGHAAFNGLDAQIASAIAKAEGRP